MDSPQTASHFGREQLSLMLTAAQVSQQLSPAELFTATGKRKAASQAAVLARMGVPFAFLGRAIRVDRHVALAHELLPNAKPAGVDLSRVR